ncbi:MAG: hypothetical protein RL341_1831, partial [Pseudomonadota bacterium]
GLRSRIVTPIADGGDVVSATARLPANSAGGVCEGGIDGA